MSRLTPEVLLAAHAKGLVRLRVAPLARAAGRCEKTITDWVDGEPVTPETNRAICAAIGVPAESTNP